MAGVEQPPVELSTRRVLEAIAKHLGVDVGTLKGRTRTRDVATARRVAVALLRKRCNVSYRDIGVLLGRRHQTLSEIYRSTGAWPHTRELVEFVDRMMRQEAPRTRRAALDIEEEFRRAREDAGVATLPRPRPR